MQNATRVLLKKKNSQLKKVIYDPVDVRISVSNTNVRSDGGGGGRSPEPPDPPLDPPLFCMNARPHHRAFAGFPKQNDKCQTNA